MLVKISHEAGNRGGSNMIHIGVIGYGYWGPNIVRNFNSVEGAAK